jgi:hypothetical protein
MGQQHKTGHVQTASSPCTRLLTDRESVPRSKTRSGIVRRGDQHLSGNLGSCTAENENGNQEKPWRTWVLSYRREQKSQRQPKRQAACSSVEKIGHACSGQTQCENEIDEPKP